MITGWLGVAVVSAGSLALAISPAMAGTDTDSGALAAVAVSVPDVEWAGGSCMNVPVAIAVRTASYATSWTGSLWSKGDSVYFLGTGSQTSTTRDLEICNWGSRFPGTQYLSGSITFKSGYPSRTEELNLSTQFSLSKARTHAVITSLRRSYGRVTLRGEVTTQDGLVPGGGYVRVEARKPGHWQSWRTMTTFNMSYQTHFSTVGSFPYPKRTKYRLSYEGYAFANPARSRVRVR